MRDSGSHFNKAVLHTLFGLLIVFIPPQSYVFFATATNLLTARLYGMRFRMNSQFDRKYCRGDSIFCQPSENPDLRIQTT